MAEFADRSLGAEARRRMDVALPHLLRALRWRRRRRHLRRAGVAVVLLASAVFAFRQPSTGAPSPSPPPPPREPVAAAESWSLVGNDPAVVNRCAVATVVRREWFVDDAGLQQMLRDDARPAGLVRAQGQVLVSAAAVDPFPALQP